MANLDIFRYPTSLMVNWNRPRLIATSRGFSAELGNIRCFPALPETSEKLRLLMRSYRRHETNLVYSPLHCRTVTSSCPEQHYPWPLEFRSWFWPHRAEPWPWRRSPGWCGRYNKSKVEWTRFLQKAIFKKSIIALYHKVSVVKISWKSIEAFSRNRRNKIGKKKK